MPIREIDEKLFRDIWEHCGIKLTTDELLNTCVKDYTQTIRIMCKSDYVTCKEILINNKFGDGCISSGTASIKFIGIVGNNGDCHKDIGLFNSYNNWKFIDE